MAFSVSGFVNKLIDQLNSESMDGLDDYAYNRLMDILVICFVITTNYISFFILLLVLVIVVIVVIYCYCRRRYCLNNLFCRH